MNHLSLTHLLRVKECFHCAWLIGTITIFSLIILWSSYGHEGPNWSIYSNRLKGCIYKLWYRVQYYEHLKSSNITRHIPLSCLLEQKTFSYSVADRNTCYQWLSLLSSSLSPHLCRRRFRIEISDNSLSLQSFFFCLLFHHLDIHCSFKGLWKFWENE